MEKRRRRVPQSVSPTGVRCTARRLDGHFTQTILPHTPPRSRARLGVADLNGFSDGELRAQVAVASENAGPGVCSRIQDSSVTRECRLSGSAAKKPLPRTDRPTVLPRLGGNAKYLLFCFLCSRIPDCYHYQSDSVCAVPRERPKRL